MLLTTYSLTRNITYKQKTMDSFLSKSTIFVLNKNIRKKKYVFLAWYYPWMRKNREIELIESKANLLLSGQQSKQSCMHSNNRLALLSRNLRNEESPLGLPCKIIIMWSHNWKEGSNSRKADKTIFLGKLSTSRVRRLLVFPPSWLPSPTILASSCNSTAAPPSVILQSLFQYH